MAQMDNALAHLDAQKQLNYAEASKLFSIPMSALARRYQGKQAIYSSVFDWRYCFPASEEFHLGNAVACFLSTN